MTIFIGFIQMILGIIASATGTTRGVANVMEIQVQTIMLYKKGLQLLEEYSPCGNG